MLLMRTGALNQNQSVAFKKKKILLALTIIGVKRFKNKSPVHDRRCHVESFSLKYYQLANNVLGG